MAARTLTCAGLAALGRFVAVAASGYADDTVCHGSLCAPIQERSSHVLGFPQLLQFRPGWDTHTINLQCSIPSETEYGISHLTTYRVLSTPP